MAVMREEARRCVVWFGQPAGDERAGLANAGWIIRVADAGTQGGVGMRNNDTVVALDDLRHGNPTSTQAMAQLMGPDMGLGSAILLLALLPAVCEEFAFRGFIGGILAN